MDASKVKGVLRWPVPKSEKDLWGFLRLPDYYKRFIKNYRVFA